MQSLVTPIASLLVASAAWGLPQDLTDAQIEADLDFAKGLAGQWGFVDIAESVLESLEGTNLSRRQQDQASVVRAQLYSESGRLERDPAKRRELYDRAIEEYRAFLDGRSDSDFTEDAQSGLVSAAFTYAQYLNQDLEEAVGEEAQTLREKQTNVLNDTVSLTGEAVESLKEIKEDERTAKQTSQLFGLLLQRGKMLAMIAKNSEDGEYYYDLAQDTLAELSAIAGDGTPGAFFAFDAMGEIFEDQGAWEDAAGFYDSVLESCVPFSMDEWKALKEEFELGQAAVELRFTFVQISVDGAIRAYRAFGLDDEAIARAMYFFNLWKMEGISLSQAGQEALLVAARALLDSNGFVGGDATEGNAQWFATEQEMKDAVRSRRDQTDTTTLAIELATEINDSSAFGYLRTRAQKLLAEIAETPGIEVSPELQMQAVLGEYRSDNLDAAIDKAHRLAGQLLSSDNKEDRVALMPQLYNTLGNIYRKQDRNLEAAMAFREGAKEYAGTDPEVDSRSARAFNSLIARMVPPGDSSNPLAPLVRESEQLVQALDDSSAGGILYNAGMKLMRQDEFDLAIKKFQQVPIEDNYGEVALTQIGVAYTKLRQADDAIQAFERYLTEIVTDPQYDTESQVRQNLRKEALAIAEFYAALNHSLKKEHSKAIPYLEGYETRHDTQEALQRSAISLLMRSFLELGDTQKARAALERLEGFAPDHPVTSRAAASFYLQLKEMYDKAQDEGEKQRLLTEMAERLELANRTSADYGTLWNEGDHWLELGNETKALVALRRLYANFKDSEDAETAEKVTKFVIPRLAELLVNAKEVVEASEMLTPLIRAEIASEGAEKVNRNTTLLWIKTLTGWLEGGANGSAIVQVPGTSGDSELFEHATTKLESYLRTPRNFSCAWFDLKFMENYTYYMWGDVDSSKGDSVGERLADILAQMNGWEDIDQQCEKSDDEELKARTTDKVLSGHFRWLAGRTQ